MNHAATIDVSQLPPERLDHRAPLWWGNLLLLVIETVMFGILVASYFYIRKNFIAWPPPRVDRFPVLYDTRPDLLFPTLNLLLLAVSCIPMRLAERAATRIPPAHSRLNFLWVLCILLGGGAIALRLFEFPGLHFKWNDNAYGSIAWTILIMHLVHLTAMTLECVVVATWLFQRPLDLKHALDVRLVAYYWYWVVGIWVPLYGLIYFGPRLF
jgi:cytochrome c oxidase subunit 3